MHVSLSPFIGVSLCQIAFRGYSSLIRCSGEHSDTVILLGFSQRYFHGTGFLTALHSLYWVSIMVVPLLPLSAAGTHGPILLRLLV